MWWRQILARLGVAGSTVLVTVVAMISSLLAALPVMLLFTGGIARSGVVVSLLVPALVAPPLSVLLLRMLFTLDRLERQLREISYVDELTGAYNRRYFVEQSEKETARAGRSGEQFSIILFDIDGLKGINDNHGHLVGDRVLRRVSQGCRQTVRRSDVFARLGGDEFAFLLPRTTRSEAMQFAERVREVVEAAAFADGEEPVPVSGSFGVATREEYLGSLEELLEEADRALYDAKRGGGNRIVVS